MKHLFIFGIVFIFFLILENFITERKAKVEKGKRILFHLLIGTMNSVISRLVLLVPLLWLSVKCENAPWTLMGFFDFHTNVDVILIFLLVDAYEYGWHRLNHRLPFLWSFHRVHHIDEELDTTTALRFHVGEIALSYGAKAVFIVLVGPSWGVYMFSRLMISCAALFHHSNIRLGPRFEKILGWFVMTPKVHAGHHTVTSRTREANYSTILIIWDKLFKSYSEPYARETQNLGLPEKMRKSFDLKEFLMLPLVNLSKER